MNSNDTLDLFRLGAAEWNKWAKTRLAERAKLEAAAQFHGNAKVEWELLASADFRDHNFDDEADFSGFNFPGDADFTESKFAKQAWFTNSRFGADVRFDRAEFKELAHLRGAEVQQDGFFREAVFADRLELRGVRFLRNAWFDKAAFKRDAEFEEVRFAGDTVFSGAMFGDKADFRYAEAKGTFEARDCQFGDEATFYRCNFAEGASFSRCIFNADVSFQHAVFDGPTDFNEARFEQDPSFIAMRGQSSFSLSHATFRDLPDFAQAHFDEAPSLDSVRIKRVARDEAAAHRWRSLRKLATQGHDHERELLYFANEVRSFRGVTDYGLPHLLNLLKRRKLVPVEGSPHPVRQTVWMWEKGDRPRPVAVWPGAARYWIGWLYEITSNFGRSMILPLLWWLAGILVFGAAYLVGLNIPTLLQAMTTACTGGNQHWVAALNISISRALVISGLTQQQLLTQSYECLYGPGPGIPDWTIFLGYGQTIYSTILLFLVILGVRNTFRIR